MICAIRSFSGTLWPSLLSGRAGGGSLGRAGNGGFAKTTVTNRRYWRLESHQHCGRLWSMRISRQATAWTGNVIGHRGVAEAVQGPLLQPGSRPRILLCQKTRPMNGPARTKSRPRGGPSRGAEVGCLAYLAPLGSLTFSGLLVRSPWLCVQVASV